MSLSISKERFDDDDADLGFEVLSPDDFDREPMVYRPLLGIALIVVLGLILYSSYQSQRIHTLQLEVTALQKSANALIEHQGGLIHEQDRHIKFLTSNIDRWATTFQQSQEVAESWEVLYRELEEEFERETKPETVAHGMAMFAAHAP